MQTQRLRPHRALARLVAMLMTVTAGAVALAPAAETQSNPYERGPDPTVSQLEARSGPYSTSSTRVSSFSARGFGGGTIYYPTTTSDGTFGGVAISPGFTAGQSSISWLGPRLASHGFVVITIDTNSRFDQPGSRARQLQAALDHIVDDRSVRDRIDEDRLAVMGHSMGGGGALIAADNNSDLRASIPLAPWSVSNNYRSVDVPTMVVACERDATARVSSHASPQYNSLPDSPGKAFLEIARGSHFCPNSTNTTIGRYAVSWLKRFVDDDTRYDPYLCGEPHQDAVRGSSISEYRETCPYS